MKTGAPEDGLALSDEHAHIQQEIYALENDISVSQLLASRQMIYTDNPTKWGLFDLNLAEI